MTAAAFWEQLRSDGLVEGDYAPPKRLDSPWFVRVMLGFAGWIGALFLLLFVGAAFAFVMSSASSSLVLGAMCCGGALLLFRGFGDNDFTEQFALAISIAGQVMILIGLAQAFEVNEPPFYLVTAAIEAGLVLLIPNFLHRALCSAGSALAFALAISLLELHGLAAPVIAIFIAAIWLDPRLWAGSGRLWRPIGYGLVLALLLVETFRLFDLQTWFGLNNVNRSGMEIYGPLIGRAVTGALLVWVAFAIGARENSSPRVRLAIAAGAALFGLIALLAPGLASAVLILLLGFSAGNRLLMALGVLALLGFVSHYYYSLHATLLEKSGLLALTGLVLIAAYAALRLFLPAEPDERASAPEPANA